MKMRTDFVTNSSSSSFLLSRKGELTKEQKDAIADLVEARMLGEPLLTPDSTEEEIKKVIEENYLEDNEDEIRAALKDGRTVYQGYVTFEEAEYHYGALFQSFWDVIEDADDENFEIIEGSLMD